MAKIHDRVEVVENEILYIDMAGGRPNRMHILYENIVSIRFYKTTIKKLFKKIDTEAIDITLRRMENPIHIYANEAGEFWEHYKTDIAKFAKDFRVSFYNELK